MARRHHWPPEVVDALEDGFADHLLAAESGYDMAVADLQKRVARKASPPPQNRPLYGMGGMAG